MRSPKAPKAALVALLSGLALAACQQPEVAVEQVEQRAAVSSTVAAEPAYVAQQLFPGHRLIALYGHPSGPALGVLGEQPPAEAVARVQQLVDAYQPLSAEPVLPAFEIIATVASADAGADGNYSNETDPTDLMPAIDAITAAGGWAVLDFQPGRASLLEQVQDYAELLKGEHVGVAIDAEWALEEGQLPAEQVGHVQAEDINAVTAWLAEFVRENNLPQKPVIVHQFQTQMIRQRETLVADHPELALVIHADGHGTAEEKYYTWDVIRAGLDPRIQLAWKNFYDEDKPMFTPEETMAVAPTPVFISYQ